LLFFICQKAQHFVFIVSIHKQNIHLTGSNDVQHAYVSILILFCTDKKKKASL